MADAPVENDHENDSTNRRRRLPGLPAAGLQQRAPSPHVHGLAARGHRTAFHHDTAAGYYAQGRVEHATLHPARARRAYMLALQLDPRHRGARNGMAVLLAEQGQYAAAITVWRGLLMESKTLPASEQAFLLANVGYALYLGGDQHQALAALKMACQLDPSQPLPWEHLAVVLETLGQKSDAEPLLRQARSLREHDLDNDYALTGTGPAPAPAPAPAAEGENPWPADLPRTEIVVTGPAMVEVRTVAPPRPEVQAPVPRARRAPPPQALPATPAPVPGQGFRRATGDQAGQDYGVVATESETGWLSAR